MSDYYKSLSFFSLLHSSIKYTAFHKGYQHVFSSAASLFQTRKCACAEGEKTLILWFLFPSSLTRHSSQISGLLCPLFARQWRRKLADSGRGDGFQRSLRHGVRLGVVFVRRRSHPRHCQFVKSFRRDGRFRLGADGSVRAEGWLV